jgi:hypothetical protein
MPKHVWYCDLGHILFRKGGGEYNPDAVDVQGGTSSSLQIRF